MRLAKIIVGDINQLTGGYLYQKKLVDSLRSAGEDVTVESVPSLPLALGMLVAPWVWMRLRRKAYRTVLIDEMAAPQTWPVGLFGLGHRRGVLSLVHMLKAADPKRRLSRAFWRMLERTLLQGTDLIIVNSFYTLHAVVSLGIDEGKVRVVYPGFDLLGKPRKRIRDSESPLKLVFVGSVVPNKGLHVLIEAMGRLPTELVILDVLGNAAGSSGYHRRLKKRIVNYGLQRMVRFHGEVPRDRVRMFYDRADVLVVPSFYEAFGIVLLEAMALGIPAIASNVGGIPEVVQGEYSGLLVPPDDPKALAFAIERMAYEQNLLERLSLGALKRIQGFQEWEGCFKEILEIVRAL